jgi:hypothetical protein
VLNDFQLERLLQAMNCASSVVRQFEASRTTAFNNAIMEMKDSANLGLNAALLAEKQG